MVLMVMVVMPGMGVSVELLRGTMKPRWLCGSAALRLCSELLELATGHVI